MILNRASLKVMSIFVTGVINCLTCHLPASAAASDLAVAGRLQAEGRPLHRAQRSGQQHLPYQTGHQRQRHGGHGGQDAGQGPADQHQTAVREQPERRLAQPHRMSSGAERLVGAIHALCVCVCAGRWCGTETASVLRVCRMSPLLLRSMKALL